MRQLRKFDPARGADLLSWLTIRLLRVVDRHALRIAADPPMIPLADLPHLPAPGRRLGALDGRAIGQSSTMMKVEDVAERWDLNIKTVYAMITRGELAARRCGRVVRIPRRVVESFESQGRDGAGR